jgi:hypothetical protein
MDLTNYGPIYIRRGVTLTSEQGNPPVAIRNAHRLGPRIFTRSRPKPLFLIRCNSDNTILGDHVRISGFRLQGPHYQTMDGDANLETGIKVASCVDVEISNMEISGWSGSGVSVEDGDNPRIHGPGAIRIHDNYIHHHQHKGGFGYGVVVGAGAWATIQRNVFDFNRHAIAAPGAVGGYYAALNLILKGGGVHGRFYNHYTHQFDVHGTDGCFPTWEFNCGKAGEKEWFYDNAFQYHKDNAIKLRGTPQVGAWISRNVFTEDVDDAVALYSGTRVHLGTGAQRNIPNHDSYGRYGVCDFNGDRKDDLFLPTGVTWWFSSGGRMQWTFLKAATQRLEQVGLGDFNADGRCDVLSPNGSYWEISSGGSGPWTRLPGTYPVPFSQLRFADFNGDRVTDIFRRTPSGQWMVVSPGRHGWRYLQNSAIALSELKFGDVTGDRKADVLSRAGGRWSISSGGAAPWTRLNQTLNTDLKTVLVGDIDGNSKDDIVRFRGETPVEGTWEVSWGGTTPWRTLRTFTVPAPPAPPAAPLVYARVYVGNFNGGVGDDLLHVDYVRKGRLYSYAGGAFGLYNLFEY